MQKIYIGTTWEKLLQGNIIKFKGSPRFLENCFFIRTTYFEEHLVNYFFENQGEQTCQTIK